MNNYEFLYIIRCDIEDEQKAAVVEKYENLVPTLNGTVSTVDKWGMKKFAYEINKKTEGYYVLMNISCSVEAQSEIERQMKIDDAIVRQIIIRK